MIYTILTPTKDTIPTNIVKAMITNLLGSLNIEFSDDALAFATEIVLNDAKKEDFSKEMEKLGLQTLFIQANENLIDLVSSKNTIDLTKCKYEE